jgi:hypothetical protein
MQHKSLKILQINDAKNQLLTELVIIIDQTLNSDK